VFVVGGLEASGGSSRLTDPAQPFQEPGAVPSPAGFERFFEELVDLGGVTQADPSVLGELCARYELEMTPGSVPELVQRFGLRFPGEPV
jgi:hypothetical protein